MSQKRVPPDPTPRDPAPMIDCREAERRLHTYVDRELSEGEVAEVQRHLEQCENCRARFRFEFGLRRLVRQAVEDQPPAPQRLRERISRLRSK
ncbi:MAG: zf-HC2 domain-containing protein [Chloroflexi bacterium]|nr:zf-HC2 domain-containing protein [Chloroflexota bacterium]